MSIHDSAGAVAAPNFFFLSPEMTRDERSRTVRAFLDDAEKRGSIFTQDPVEISAIAQRASEAVKHAKHITHQHIAAMRAKAEEAERSNKVLLELQTYQGRITIDHTGISSNNGALLDIVQAAFEARHESGELSEPADKSEYLSQLIEVVKSLYGKDAEISKVPEAELKLANALGAVTLLSDGSITATGGMAAIIADLLKPGNALSAQPSDRLDEIIARRMTVLQSLFSTSQ